MIRSTKEIVITCWCISSLPFRNTSSAGCEGQRVRSGALVLVSIIAHRFYTSIGISDALFRPCAECRKGFSWYPQTPFFCLPRLRTKYTSIRFDLYLHNRVGTASQLCCRALMVNPPHWDGECRDDPIIELSRGVVAR